MGDERRDFDTPGRTNGQHDQAEPVPPQDDTQPFAAPDRTQAGAAGETEPGAEPVTGPVAEPGGAPDETEPSAAPDETRPIAAAPDETAPMAAPDETQPIAAAPDDHTEAIPPRAAWSGRAGVPPRGPSLRDSAPYTREIPPPAEPRPWWTPVLLGVLALGLVGILILVAWWMGRDDSPAPVESPSAEVVVPTAPTEPTTQPPTAATASPTAQVVSVPRLVGLDLDAAVAELDQLGLAYRFEYRTDEAPQGRVIGSSPPEGLVVPIQTTVTLIISTGSGNSPTPSSTPAEASASPEN